MMNVTPSTWLHRYLSQLHSHPDSVRARAVAPLWLARDADASIGNHDLDAPMTIQMAADIFHRLVLVGPSGAGKSTTLRQLAGSVADALLSNTAPISGGTFAIPVYIELAHVDGSLEHVISALLGNDAPPLAELVQERALLVLLDGLDALPPTRQLRALATINQMFSSFGTQVRCIISCRSESLPLFQPWLAEFELRSVRPLAERQVISAVQQHVGAACAAWLERAKDLVELATRPRWLAALLESSALRDAPPLHSGAVLAAWLPMVLTMSASTTTTIAPELALAALAQIAALGHASMDADAASAAVQPLHIHGQRLIDALVDAGILIANTPQHTFDVRHSILRWYALGTLLAACPPSEWPSSVFTRAGSAAAVFAYQLTHDRSSVLRYFIEHGALHVVVQCVMHTDDATSMLEILEQTVTFTPPLRVRLAAALADEGKVDLALVQLERAGADDYDDIELFGRLGDLYSATEQWERARLAYEQALERDAEQPQYQKQLGIVYSQLGLSDQAATTLEAVLALRQRNTAETVHALGNVYREQGQHERALAAYQQAVTNDPHTAVYHHSHARALCQLERSDEAVVLLERMLERQPVDAGTYSVLAAIYANTGRTQEALHWYSRAVSHQPADVRLYIELGRLRRCVGDLVGARAAFQRAAALDASDAALHDEIGQLCEQCGETLSAIAAYQRAVQIDASGAAYQWRLGVLLRDQGELDEALPALRAACAHAPRNASTHRDLGELLLLRGAHAQALDLFRRALDLSGDGVVEEHALGRAYERAKQLALALVHLGRAATRAATRADWYYDAATVAEALAESDVALVYYAQALALDPQLPYIVAAATLHARRGNRRQARTLWARALRCRRDDGHIHAQLGALHAQDSNWARAARAFQRATRTVRSVPILAQFGGALLKLGHDRTAGTVFEQALQLDSENAEVLYLYSLALEHSGRIEAAYVAARHAAQLAGGEPHVQQRAGILALHLGRPHEAVGLFDQVIALDPQQPDTHTHKAQALYDLGCYADAVASARTALAFQPDAGAALLIVGQALFHLGQAAEARPFLEQALARNPSPGTARAYLRDVYITQGMTSAALEQARHVVAQQPYNAQDVLQLGTLLLAAGERDAALVQFERVLQLDEHVAEAHSQLSRVFAAQEHHERARYHAERACDLDPESPDAHAWLAQLFANIGMVPRAISALEAAITRRPTHAEWHFTLGTLRQRAGTLRQALPALQRAVTLDPAAAPYQHALALLHQSLGDMVAATFALEQAVRLQPEHVAWRAQLADMYRARGWHAEALQELNRVIAAAPTSADYWEQRAHIYQLMNRDAEALRDFSAALQRDSQRSSACAALARGLLAQGRVEHALKAAQRAVTLEPDDPAFRHTLAQVLRARGDHLQARAQFAQALRAGGPTAWWIELANTYAELHQGEQTLRAWQQAHTQAPDDAEVLWGYGRALIAADEHAAAISVLERASALLPHNSDVMVCLAEALIAHGETARAVPYAQRAIALKPDDGAGWCVLGNALWVGGQAAEAEEALEHAHTCDPNDARAAALLGETLVARGAFAPAAKAFAAAAHASGQAHHHARHGSAQLHTLTVRSDPDELRGALRDEHATLAAARAALTEATTHDPTHSAWWYELGLVDQMQAEHQVAALAFDRALALRPAHAETYWRRAISRFVCGHLDAARTDLDFALADGVTDIEAYTLLGRIAFDRGDDSTALRALQQVANGNAEHHTAHWYLGRVLVRQQAYTEAINVLERAAELRPDHAPTLAALSDAYAGSHRHERALATIRQALRIDAGVAEFHQRLATLQAGSGNLREARRVLLCALALRDEPAWHAQMADICVQLGMDEAARNAYRHAIARAPDVPEYAAALARLLLADERLDEAQALFAQAVARTPTNGAWQYARGQLLTQIGDHAAATAAYRAAVQSTPGTLAHWLSLASAQQTQHPTHARETLERAIQYFNDEPSLHLAAGRMYEAAGDHAVAHWHYSVATERDATVAEHWVRLGVLQQKQGDAVAAHAAFERALTLHERTAEAHSWLAHLLLEADDVHAAVQHGERAVQIDPTVAEHHAHLARGYARLRLFVEAMQAFHAAVTLRSDDAELQAEYGEQALHAGLYREALDASERALVLEPNNARYYLLAGRAHRRLKNYSRAIERLRRAVRLKPGYSEAVLELSTLGPLAFVAHHIKGEER